MTSPLVNFRHTIEVSVEEFDLLVRTFIRDVPATSRKARIAQVRIALKRRARVLIQEWYDELIHELQNQEVSK